MPKKIVNAALEAKAIKIWPRGKDYITVWKTHIPGSGDRPVSANDRALSSATTGVDVTGGLDTCGGPGLAGCGKDV